MLTDKIHHTPASHKIILTFAVYFLYLLVNVLTSNIKNPFGNLIDFGFAIITAWLIFYNVKTTQILLPKKVKIPFTMILFIILLGYFLIVIVHPIENINKVLLSSKIEILNSFLVAITAGIFEEFLVRVFLLDGIAQLLSTHKYGILQAAIYSSTIFGIMHLSNLTFQSANTTLQQIMYAIAIGLMLSFIRLKTNGITLCIILHSIVDLQPHINTSATSTSWQTLIILFLPVFSISIWGIYRINKKLL